MLLVKAAEVRERCRIIITMSEKRFHPQWHLCECNPPVPLLMLTSQSAANPGRDFFMCQNKDQKIPGSGCSKQFCWADEYPQGFEKKKFSGGGRGGGGYRGGRGGGNVTQASHPPRAQYSGFASSPQPTQVPQPDFTNKRQRTDDEQPAPQHASIEMLNEVLQNLEAYKKELMDEINGLREVVITMANDIVGAIKENSSVEEMST
ncbi:DNA lyase [Yaravirus sp. 'brasiliensis']|uniref:DNA lyase n=1 Tax=Yaravirus sp. 'brasiliensis' TaxID=2739681 RepID=A0AAE7B4F1_9VIRU|nr:DNA lyase [Yaravirus brasiliensis]QKE44440.1 DNA lyase [Yaravirus brasiliensis]